MDPALKLTVARGGYQVDPHAVAAAMLAFGRGAFPLKAESDVLVAPEVVDGCSAGADQDEPAALEGAA
jgi:hypothetical protein